MIDPKLKMQAAQVASKFYIARDSLKGILEAEYEKKIQFYINSISSFIKLRGLNPLAAAQIIMKDSVDVGAVSEEDFPVYSMYIMAATVEIIERKLA